MGKVFINNLYTRARRNVFLYRHLFGRATGVLRTCDDP